jgi:hypothetical protein
MGERAYAHAVATEVGLVVEPSPVRPHSSTVLVHFPVPQMLARFDSLPHLRMTA